MLTFLNSLLQWLYRRPLSEPRGLFRLFKIGVLIIFIGTLSAVLVGHGQGLWNFTSPPPFNTWSRCDRQNKSRQADEQDIIARWIISKDRLDELNKALVAIGSASHGDVRTAISIEEKLKSGLERKYASVQVETLRHFLPNFIVGLVLVVLFALVAARLAGHHGLAVLGAWSRKGESENWQSPYWSWVALIFCAHAARETFTSVLATTNKSWFAWSSFCVSSTAWTLMLVVTLGVAMVVAYPATILWHFGRDSIRPVTLNIEDKDGQWGVGSYLLFLQIWSTLSLVFLVLPVAMWLRTVRDNPRLSLPYLLTSGVLFTAGLVISGRMIRNAIAIRRTYQTELKKLGKTWQEIQAMEPPGDPTGNFLGEHWWNLPTLLFGIFAVLWFILEQIGVSDFLAEITGMK